MLYIVVVQFGLIIALGHKLYTALRFKTLSVECPFNSGLIVKQHFIGVSLLAHVKSRALHLG